VEEKEGEYEIMEKLMEKDKNIQMQERETKIKESRYNEYRLIRTERLLQYFKREEERRGKNKNRKI